MLADAKNRDDVRMVQARGGLGFALEAFEIKPVDQPVERQHFQRHTTAERPLFGLVDDPHAAVADLAQNAIIAEVLWNGGWRRRTAAVAARKGLQIAHKLEAGQHLSEDVRDLRVALRILFD